jgi:uncharacterized membrane protein YqjE
MAEDSANGAARAGGLLGSIRNLAATLVALLQTRLQLLGNELQEEKLRFGRLLVMAAAAILFLVLGILLLTLLFIVLFWDTHRLLVIALFAGAYLAAGLVLLSAVRKAAAERSRLFEASLGELAKDYEQLTS